MSKKVDVNNRLVSSFEEMKAVAKQIQSAPGAVSLSVLAQHGKFDFQTEDNYLKGLAFALESGECWYIPLRHGCDGQGVGEDRDVIVNFLKPILETQEIVCFYSKFVIKAFMHYGVRVNVTHDTFVLGHQYTNYYDQPNELVAHLEGMVVDQSIPAKPPVNGSVSDQASYCCADAVSNLRMLVEVFRPSVFFNNPVYDADIAFALACAYSEYFGLHHASLAVSEEPGSRQLIFQEVVRFPRINYASDDGKLTVSKPDYLNASDHLMMSATPRNGYYMAYGGYPDLYVRVAAAIMGGSFGDYVDSCDHEGDLFEDLVWKFSDLLSSAGPEMQREVIRMLVYVMIDFREKDEMVIERMFGDVTPETEALCEALYQRFIKLFDDPDESLLDYIADARELGYVQSYFGRYFSCRGVDEVFEERGGSEAANRDLVRHVIRLTTIDIYKQGVNRLMDEIYRRGWFGKVLLPAFIKGKLQNAVLMEIDNTISPDEVAAVLKEAFIFDTDDKVALDYQIGFGKSWDEAYCNVLDGIDERVVFDDKLMPWQHNIDDTIRIFEALRADDEDKPVETGSNKKEQNKKELNKKEQKKKGQDKQNKKFKWFH